MKHELSFIVVAALGVGCRGAAPARAPLPPPLPPPAVQCPVWPEPSAKSGETPERSAPRDWATMTQELEALMSQGRLLEARDAAAHAAAQCRSRPGTISRAEANELAGAFEKLRQALQAPASGDSYVEEARAASARGESSNERAAWDRAYLAYARETHTTGELTALHPVSYTWARSHAYRCGAIPHDAPKTSLVHQIWRLGKTDQLLWRLRRTVDGPVLFEGVVERLEPLSDDAWFVVREGKPTELFTSRGETRRLDVADEGCGPDVHVVGSWLIWRGNDQHVHFIDSRDLDDHFDGPTPPNAGRLEVRSVGRYLLLSTVDGDDAIPMGVFRMDAPAGKRQVWPAAEVEGAEGGTLYDVPKWGGVLTQQTSRPQPKNELGFEWDLRAIQVETGKQLAQVVLAPSAVDYPVATVSARYGFVVVGHDGDVRISELGSGTSRRVTASKEEGQVEQLAVSDDGLLCVSRVVDDRYDSCALTIEADLRGAGRERDRDMVCLRHGEHVWTSRMHASPGHDLVSSGGRTVLFGVCGQVLSPDGHSAAFLEAEPRKSSEEPYTGAGVLLVDTRNPGKPRRLSLEGSVDSFNPFIDLAYSPDGRYLAVLYAHRVEVFRVADGVQVGTHLDAPEWLGVEWLDDTSLTGGAGRRPVYHLEDGHFVADAGDSAPADESRCRFGSRLVPAEVCRGLPKGASPARPRH